MKVMQSKYLHVLNKTTWPLYKWEHIYPLLGKKMLYFWNSGFVHSAAKTQQKNILIALIFNENAVWVESKVCVHPAKTAEPGTNMHCSTL